MQCKKGKAIYTKWLSAQFIAQVEVGGVRDNRIVVRDVIEQLYEFKLDTLPSSTPRPNAPLLLLTAHSAKGMEFDHVLILDNGNWQQNDDAERRLFYVAMTRTRQTLTLCHSPALGHAFYPGFARLGPGYPARATGADPRHHRAL